MPYGFHTVIFSYLDTYHNMFKPFTGEFYPILLRMLHHAHRAYDLYIEEALEKRMGMSFETFDEILIHIHENMKSTINQILAMPEQDDWVYSKGKSMPSPGFVMQLYNAAGLFAGLEINGNEFTAKDIY